VHAEFKPQQLGISMHTQTHDDYFKLALYFLSHNVERATDDRNGALLIQQMLINCAFRYRPAYWRRLRCALVYSFNYLGQPETAAVIQTSVNPITIAGSKNTSKPKQKRKKQVSKQEHGLIKSALLNKMQTNPMDECLLAALDIVSILGCRPSEMLSLKLKPNSNQVFIPSAKKTSNDLRGLDRTVLLPQTEYDLVAQAQQTLSKHRDSLCISKSILQSRLQRKLARVTEKLWPKQKHRITFYTYRHLMGSDLKRSSKSRREVAAIMGHQSVDSVDVYGDRRCSGLIRDIKATQQTIDNVRKTVSNKTSFWFRINSTKRIRKP